MFYFGISKLEYQKLFSYMKSITSNFLKCQVSHKTKNLKFGTKNTLSGHFWDAVLKGYCHIWNQHSRVCQNAKFNKFGTKNVLFAYFSAGTWKNYYHIGSLHPRIFRNAKTQSKNLVPKIRYLGIFGCNFEKLLPYLKKAPSNLWKCKVLGKN